MRRLATGLLLMMGCASEVPDAGPGDDAAAIDARTVDGGVAQDATPSDAYVNPFDLPCDACASPLYCMPELQRCSARCYRQDIADKCMSLGGSCQYLDAAFWWEAGPDGAIIPDPNPDAHYDYCLPN